MSSENGDIWFRSQCIKLWFLILNDSYARWKVYHKVVYWYPCVITYSTGTCVIESSFSFGIIICHAGAIKALIQDGGIQNLIDTLDKICRRYFQVYFREWNAWFSNIISLKYVP